MLNVIHTFEGPDQDLIMAEISRGLESVSRVQGFKYASINKQLNTDEIMVVSKWDNETSYETWAKDIGENKAFKQATPQMFEVLNEKY